LSGSYSHCNRHPGEALIALVAAWLTLFRPQIAEAVVVAIPSEQWGQKVAAVVVLDPEKSQGTGRGGKPWGVMDMRRALRSRLANYKIPQEMRIIEGSIPRNAMGKGESVYVRRPLMSLTEMDEFFQ
jgi:acyl-CoA synthetase (AMP-forming)/AMP-acid ligase II